MSAVKQPQGESSLHDVQNRLAVLEENFESIKSQNNEILSLLRVLAQPVLFDALQEIFKTPKQLYIYELSDGERSTRDIGKLVRLDQKGISNSWREWEKAGLVEKVGKKGQFKACYTLLELLVVYLPTRKTNPKS